jgi:ParB family transcriptional regulator, chromosome partitioning protein
MVKRKFSIANNPLLAGPALQEREQGVSPYREVSLTAIAPDPRQPRTIFDEEKLQELAFSIKTYGVLSPILVRANKDEPGKYTLVAGERRLRAAKIAGLTSIPVMLNGDSSTDTSRTLAMQLVENLQRADLSPLERAHAIGALKESHGLSVRDIGERLGVSKSMVQRSLDILSLPADLLNALKDGAAESKVLLLSKIEDEEIRATYLKELDVLSRSQLQKDLDRETVRKATPSEVVEISPEDRRISDEIQRAVGSRVRLVRNRPEGDSGRLIIDFYSSEDLKVLFRRLVEE